MLKRSHVVIYLFTLVVLIGLTATFEVSQAQAPCIEYGTCTPIPPTSPAWDGYSDDRLNPQLDEYYSVWCQEDTVRVLRGVPSTALVMDIPLIDIVNMPDGSQKQYSDHGLTVSKTGDAITLTGSNGNTAPQPGSKTFSLSECIDRNGGVPAQPTLTPPTQPTATAITCPVGQIYSADSESCVLFYNPATSSNNPFGLACCNSLAAMIVMPGALLTMLRRWRRKLAS